jgi:hypothetical protein
MVVFVPLVAFEGDSSIPTFDICGEAISRTKIERIFHPHLIWAKGSIAPDGN